MKLANILLLGASALFHRVMATPIGPEPAASPEAETWSEDNNNSTDTSSLESRCTWNDGHGPIHCDYFSVIIPHFYRRGNLAFGIYGNNFAVGRTVNCNQANVYQSFTSPLPWVLQLHPGNACHFNAQPGSDWNNLWLRYSNQQLNTPTDSRCGPAIVGGSWDNMRCIIKQRP
ncbi:hypothetical protein QBC34DRAFT_471567 [Podospora aff. communis PSN243]|uniref:Ecp2 effector protein domain-containing protein n=1 Tax=Podospora aff. communis PSN243 TaxID=3040156 RepID=A0AAV9GAA0_9PEZI|nr:hypothetical protein QBC34DRAFT_471567 [Podospora aff. communis PSN243]